MRAVVAPAAVMVVVGGDAESQTPSLLDPSHNNKTPSRAYITSSPSFWHLALPFSSFRSRGSPGLHQVVPRSGAPSRLTPDMITPYETQHIVSLESWDSPRPLPFVIRIGQRKGWEGTMAIEWETEIKNKNMCMFGQLT